MVNSTVFGTLINQTQRNNPWARARLFKTDPLYPAYLIYTQYSLQENGHIRRQNNQYVRHKLVSALADIRPDKADIYVRRAVDLLLMEQRSGTRARAGAVSPGPQALPLLLQSRIRIHPFPPRAVLVQITG